jgi:hypothetical protein
MRQALRSRLTYANVMATVAVFIALGGASYAALKLPKNSVGSKQLKPGAVKPGDLAKNSVSSPKVANGSLHREDLAADALPVGPAGPSGEPGIPGPTQLFAAIRDGLITGTTADVQYGRGVTEVADGSPAYTVRFARSVQNCVVLAESGVGDPSGDPVFSGHFAPSVTMQSGDAQSVNVSFVDDGGSYTDTSFLIAAFC